MFDMIMILIKFIHYYSMVPNLNNSKLGRTQFEPHGARYLKVLVLHKCSLHTDIIQMETLVLFFLANF